MGFKESSGLYQAKNQAFVKELELNLSWGKKKIVRLAAHIQSADLNYHVGKKTTGLKQMQLQGSLHIESLSNWQKEEKKVSAFNLWGFGQSKPMGAVYVSILADRANHY